jgi:transcriptional regulator with XRE-family HTH domain
MAIFPGLSRQNKNSKERKLGARLKQLRQARNWSRSDLARYTDLDKGIISRLETGRINKPSPEYLVRLAHALRIEAEELLEAAGLTATNLKSDFDFLKSLEAGRERFVALIYKSTYMSAEDKQHFADKITRAFKCAELRYKGMQDNEDHYC